VCVCVCVCACVCVRVCLCVCLCVLMRFASSCECKQFSAIVDFIACLEGIQCREDVMRFRQFIM